MSFGIDLDGKTVDYGSRVKKGDVLALIDDVTYKSDLQTAQAAKAQAEASILAAEASIKECAANEVLAKNNWTRAEKLSKKRLCLRARQIQQRPLMSRQLPRVKKPKHLWRRQKHLCYLLKHRW
jgi:multidrug resistance efflux pump